MKVTMTQHAVGQGGMMSGLIETDGGEFHWVYDCGSNQLDALRREIHSVAFRKIDVLFLSHLDRDHVNGVDELLAATQVDEVVLPYLNDIDRLIAAAHADLSDSLSGNFLTFLTDVAGWFEQRGVERITFIDPNSDDGEIGPFPEMPRDFEGSGEGKIRSKWNAHSRTSETTNPVSHSSTTNLGPSAVLQTVSSYGLLNWVLCPYAHNPSLAKHKLFRNRLKELIAPDLSLSDLLQRFLKDEYLRNKVREAYNLIWSNHNLVSMALYAGPARQGYSYAIYRSMPFYPLNYILSSVGWLQTGDMHLDVRKRRERFLQYYKKGGLLEMVDVFALPHHGAQKNFHPSIFSELKNASSYFASSGPNSYGHPSQGVQDMVEAHGKRFMHVTYEGRTTFKIVIRED